MNIRSLTCFMTVNDVKRPLRGASQQPATGESASEGIRAAGQMASALRAALESAGLAVQTTRLATQPLSTMPPADVISAASELQSTCRSAGFDYLSLGPIVADRADASLSLLSQIPEIIRSTETVFTAVLTATKRGGLNLHAIRDTARVVREIAHTTPLGFGNLRLAMLANVGPLAPFFPAAYHDGGSPALALATESADLAVAAFQRADSLDDARSRLVRSVEAASAQIVRVTRPLAERFGFRFVGMDFSLAPFPEAERSIGTALEHLGIDRFGSPGTLFAAAFTTACLREAQYPRCGFNGLMLPVLEDATLANRTLEEPFTVNDLLLYSAVCGTGLDTVPLPGDVSEEELSGILLDVAALALCLDKPLTARLMPIPGSKAGDLTHFDFSYFANSHVLDVKGLGSRRLFDKAEWLALASRSSSHG